MNNEKEEEEKNERNRMKSFIVRMQYLLNLLISHPSPDSIILIQKYPDKIYEVGEKISRPLAKRERETQMLNPELSCLTNEPFNFQY